VTRQCVRTVSTPERTDLCNMGLLLLGFVVVVLLVRPVRSFPISSPLFTQTHGRELYANQP
ncbi:MAG: hypothetical protein M3014_04340, partial [Chloroflexota bacterium]|nr:hypothetical protein [Chloroflexota bacterium]